MKKMNYIKIFIALVLGFVAASCEKAEDVVDFPIVTPKLVANCFFQPDSAWNIHVSKSLSVLDNADIKVVEKATVLLYEDGVFLDTAKLDPITHFYTLSSNYPQRGKEYSIEVKAPGFTQIEASDIIPAPIPIEDLSMRLTDSVLSYDEYSGQYYGTLKYEISLTFTDPPGEDNYYQLSGYWLEKLQDWSDTTIYTIYRNDIWWSDNNQPILEETNNNYFLFSDKLISGQHFKFVAEFEDYSYFSGKTYYFELKSLSEAGFSYKKTAALFQINQGNPLVEPVQIYNNIENGFGIFSGYCPSSKIIRLN